MTKVEELLERVEAHITCEKGHDWLHEMLLTLVAVATEEGCDDGWAASKTLWTRMQKWNDEWREENPKERSLTLLDAIDLIEWKIAAAEAQGEAKGRAEGAEQEAAKVVHCGECASAKPYPDEPMVECRFGCDRPIDGFCSLGTILATATKEADHGKS